MLDSHSKTCRVCSATLPPQLTGKQERVYCSKECYKTGTKTCHETRRAMGLCKCGRPAVSGFVSCEKCRGYAKDSSIRRRRRAAKDLTCTDCHNQPDGSSKLCAQCKSKNSKQLKIRKRELKMRIVAAYGGACECCNETNIAFLSIDHINRDGAAHRKQLGFSTAYYLYRFLVLNGFPRDNYRLFCFNCNNGSFWNEGICPHQNERRALVETASS